MPSSVSKKQLRLMNAIMHGKAVSTARGDSGPPKSVAAKYVQADKGSDGSDLPESKGKEHSGGKWGEEHHKRAKEKTKQTRTDKKKKKASLRKSLEDYIFSKNNKAAGCLVVDNSKILLGKRTDSGEWACPGGHVEDDESCSAAAIRELKEESGIVGRNPKELHSGVHHGNHYKVFLINDFSGKIKPTEELSNIKWFEPHELPWDTMTQYTFDSIKKFIENKLSKSSELVWMLAEESLQKNIIRSGNAPSDTVFQVTHGDALGLVGNGAFRFLRDAVKGMQDEDFKEIPIDQYVIHIRKHTNDVYSGRIVSGQKQIHQFTNKSLPAVTAEIMSVFEWYLPEDAEELELLDEHLLDDDVIEGGLNELTENYHKHNIINIYNEMENIREEIRQGNAVDIQQVENKIMSLFNRMEETILSVVDKHNILNTDAGKAIDELEKKLLALQSKIDEINHKPTKVEAYSSSPANGNEIHNNFYPYLSKPQVTISPTGHITISFNSDWTFLERENFLTDLKAKAIKSPKK